MLGCSNYWSTSATLGGLSSAGRAFVPKHPKIRTNEEGNGRGCGCAAEPSLAQGIYRYIYRFMEMLKVSQEGNWSCTLSLEGTHRAAYGRGREGEQRSHRDRGRVLWPEEEQEWVGQRWKSSWIKDEG